MAEAEELESQGKAEEAEAVIEKAVSAPPVEIMPEKGMLQCFPVFPQPVALGN